MAYTKNHRATNTNTRKPETGSRWTEVSGEMTIWGHEAKTKAGRNYCTYTTPISRKSDDGEWDSVWLDVVFSRNANPELAERFITKIESGFMSLRVWDDKDGHHVKPCVVITEHTILD